MPVEAGAVRPFQPLRQMVRAERIVEHEFQRPRRGQRHQHFDQHGCEHDRQPASIRPQQVENQPLRKRAIA